MLSQDEPALVDGTVLSAHQVDALSGTLTALLAESQRNGNGRSNGAVADEPVELAPAGLPGRGGPARGAARRTRTSTRIRSTGPTPDEEVAEDVDDPNAAKRFWFEHATGAGKTVAALGFVEASRTGGILILTHRRNLVDQFHGELRDRGYAKRIAPALLGRQGPGQRPGDGRDLPVVRPQRGQDLRRLHDRHLRRGAHRAGREDVGVDPRLDRPGVRRHDRHGRADRPPRHRPLPDADLALRPRAGRAPRRHRAAALRADPAGPGRAHDRQGAAAPRRGRHRVRPGDAGRAARPAAVQPRGRRPLQDALQRRAGRRLLGRRAPRLQRRRRRSATSG